MYVCINKYIYIYLHTLTYQCVYIYIYIFTYPSFKDLPLNHHFCCPVCRKAAVLSRGHLPRSKWYRDIQSHHVAGLYKPSPNADFFSGFIIIIIIIYFFLFFNVFFFFNFGFTILKWRYAQNQDTGT